MGKGQVREVAGAKRVLVVEDNARIRCLLRDVLEDHGYRVLVADNGQRALELTNGGDLPVDLLLTDVVMPLMGGIQLADRMRAARPDVRVMFMSGYADSQEAVDTTSLLLAKPFSIPDLLESVRSVLDDDDKS